ncbi:cytochrome P450 [Rhizoclosmatium globosum]|uniref:aromatase n=1 Tax=Rhizoclosmatium globosum TaxID=329046 RepID=A0A1Y2D3L2_9FUNG|nr:cytochrome P450 [Rhizoclosmatium globosum]|eukprot:ORY53145.1 cytochrome P450 [Rhizoclosmatium globosum]
MLFPPRRQTNGPPIAKGYYPIIGHLFAFTNPKGNIALGSILFDGLENETVVESHLLGEVIYIARGGENVKAILGCSQLKQRTGKHEEEGATKLGMQHTGILFNSDVPTWKLHRKLFVENIARPRFLKSLIPKFNEYMDALIPALDELAASSKPILANELTGYISRDNILDIVFSDNNYSAIQYVMDTAASVDNVVPKRDELIDGVSGFMDATQYFMMLPSFVFNYVTRNETKRNEAKVKVLATLVKEKMLAKQEQLNATNDLTSQTMDFATALLQDPSPDMTFERATSVVQEAIIGGQDTSKNTLAFLIYELARNPSVTDTIYQEVIDIVGPHNPITEHDIPQLKMVEAVIFETSRYYNVITAGTRCLTQDLELPESGYVLRKGSNVFVTFCDNHMSEKEWENANKFDPTRFLASDKEGGPLGHGWGFSPFGHGVRKCPGEALALLQMKVFVASLCRRYKFHLAMTGPLQIHESINRQCMNLPVIFERR